MPVNVSRNSLFSMGARHSFYLSTKSFSIKSLFTFPLSCLTSTSKQCITYIFDIQLKDFCNSCFSSLNSGTRLPSEQRPYDTDCRAAEVRLKPNSKSASLSISADAVLHRVSNNRSGLAAAGGQARRAWKTVVADLSL